MATTVKIGRSCDCSCAGPRDEVLYLELKLTSDYLPVFDIACAGFCMTNSDHNDWTPDVAFGSGDAGEATLYDIFMYRNYCTPSNTNFYDALAHFGGAASCFQNFATALTMLGALTRYNVICLNTVHGLNTFNTDLFLEDTSAGAAVRAANLLAWLNLGNKRLLVFDWRTVTPGPNASGEMNPVLAALGSSMSVGFGNDAFNITADFATHYLTAGLSTYNVFTSNYITGGAPLVTTAGGTKVLVAVEKFAGTRGPYEIIVSGNKLAPNPGTLAPASEHQFWRRTYARNRRQGGMLIR